MFQNVVVAVSLALALASCGKRELKGEVLPTFSSIQMNSIQPKCLQCHQSLATYDGVLKVIEKGKPEESDLYKEVSEGGMPQQSPSLSAAEIQAIYDWIKAGAPND